MEDLMFADGRSDIRKSLLKVFWLVVVGEFC